MARTGDNPSFRPALEAIVAQLPGAVYAVDASGKVLYLSDQIQTLIGRSATNLVRTGIQWSSLVHHDDLERVEGELKGRDPKAVGSVPPIEYRLIHRDGTAVWVRDHAIEMADMGRRIRQGVLLDITTQRVAETSLADVEDHYRSVLESSGELILRAGLDERITFASEGAAGAFGKPASELVGSPLAELVHAADAQRMSTALRQALAEAEPRIKVRTPKEGGGWLWMRATMRVTYTRTGRVNGAQVGLRDVTEAERMSAELLDAERMLTAMLDAVDEGFVVQAADGDMLALNKRARELLGPLGAVRDRLPPGWKLLDSGGLPISATSGPTRVVLATDRPLSGRIKVQRSDGSVAWLAVECRPLHRSGEPQPFAALASFADVTAQAEAGEERRALEEEQERRRRAEEMAERLRSIFAPSSPPPTPGIKLTGVYVPAAEGMSGDWHEAIALPDGTLGLAIGDVTGHGIDAAAQMGTLRAALHAYALELHEPNLVLERLNLILRRSGARMASVLYAILDADQGILRFASAGHPPILLLSPEGEVSYLRAARSPLLGYDYGEDRVQAVVALEPGSTLLFYTDGVLEGGSKSVDDALAKLAVRVREAATFDLEALCKHVLPNNGEAGPREDDAALFACRIDGIAEPELQLQFDADPSQLRLLRHALGRWLDRLEMGQDDRFQLLLAVDEAARNAIEHAYGLEAGSFAVSAMHSDSEITIRVSDAGRWRPARGRRRGRGISLMRKLVDEMEIQDLHPGTEVTLVRKLKRARSS